MGQIVQLRSGSRECGWPKRRGRLGIVLLCLTMAAIQQTGAPAVETPWVMYEDPMLPIRAVEKSFPDGLAELWLRALARPEREMQRRAALAIAEGVSKGVPGLNVTIDSLCELLRDTELDRGVRLSVARALVALDARQAASLLIEVADPNDLEMAEVVEPALARWGDAGLRDRWVERLNGPIGLRRMSVLAIRGLAALDEEVALPRLHELALDEHVPATVRFEAADALGRLQESGLLESARTLTQDRSFAAVVERLIAVKMVAAHRGKEAEGFLMTAAVDPAPTVRAVALRNLFRIDPELLFPIIEETLESKDANVRRWGAEALIAKPTPELLAKLVSMLDDRDPEIRRHVCDSLVTLAEKPALHETILEQARNVLDADGWRGQEQATLLLVTLEETSIVNRLMELLDVERSEASVAAAWGLCQLAVPSTAEPVHEVFRKKTESSLAREPQNDGIGDQLALLAQTLGILKHAPADPVLRKYIAKGSPFDSTSRSAAIWALGKILSGKPDPQLARKLEARVLDGFSLTPESWEVCRMSAITLGRIEAKSSVPSLRSSLEQATLSSGFGYACAWALEQLGGEEIPSLDPRIELDRDWFLVPISNH